MTVRACSRRALLLAGTGALLGTLAPMAAEPNYPSRPVRLVVPFAPGSATDTMARIYAQELSPRLGQNVVVDDKPGAFGQIAAVHVAKSPADGYTLFMTTNTTHSANPHLYRSLPYDPMRDFVPIVRTATLPFMLVVTPSLPARSVAELIALARAKPGAFAYAQASSTALVAAESLNVLGKVSTVGVAYKASPQAILDVASGQVQFMIADFTTAMPHVASGRVRVLGVTTASRSALLPDVPPMAEALKGFDVTSWNGVFAPAGTPKPIVDRLARASLELLSRREVVERLAAAGFEVDPLGPDAFLPYLRAQLDYWGRLIHNAGLQPE